MKALAILVVAVLVGCSAPSSTTTSSGPSSTTTSSPSQASSPTQTPPADVLAAAQAYVDAIARGDLDGLVNAFHPDGRIVDVSRTIAGHDAIRTWARNEVIGGSLQVLDIVERRPDGQKLLVRWAPAGADGWLAHYDFTSRGNRISVADLQYA
jgi:hypothetical protein